MSSEPRWHRVVPLAVGIALLLTLGACGRKGDPQPPPRKNPERTNDLTIRQSGQELVLSMSYPTMTVGGLALTEITKLELVQYSRPAPEVMDIPLLDGEGVLIEGAESTEETLGEEPITTGPAEEAPPTDEDTGPPPAAREDRTDVAPATDEPTTTEAAGTERMPDRRAGPKGRVEGAEQRTDDEAAEEGELEEEEPNPFRSIRVDNKEFAKQAERVLTLEGPELEAAVVGGKIVIRLPLEEIPTEPPVAHAFAVETFAGRLRSPRSRPRAFVPVPPPPAPTGLNATASGEGIALRWSAVEDESEIVGYHVHRRLAESADYEEALSLVEPGITEYLDAGVPYGRTYVYTVTAVGMDKPLVESVAADEQTIEHRDRYAPRAPQGVVALAESGRVRLLWDAGRARDIAGYLVYVGEDGGELVQLTPEPVDATEFIHADTVSGTRYTYVVRVIDTSGNLSVPSAAVTTRAP